MRISSLSFTEHVNWFWLLAFGRLKDTNKNYPQEQRLISYSSTIRKASQSSVCQLKHLRLQHRCATLLTRCFWLPACEKSLAKLPTWWPAHTCPCEGWSICTGIARRGRCQHHQDTGWSWTPAGTPGGREAEVCYSTLWCRDRYFIQSEFTKALLQALGVLGYARHPRGLCAPPDLRKSDGCIPTTLTKRLKPVSQTAVLAHQLLWTFHGHLEESTWQAQLLAANV